jgi:O-antigen/teichoic acid export membrane protein
VGCIASLLAGGVLLVVLPFLATDFHVVDSPPYAVAIVIGTAAWAVGGILDSTFVAERRSDKMLIRNSFLAGSKVVLLVGVLAASLKDVLAVMVAWTGSAALGLVVGTGLLARGIRAIHRPRFGLISRSARGLRPRFVGHQLIGVGNYAPVYIVPLVVTARLSASSDAYFYTTWMVCGVFLIISPAVATSLFAEGAHSPGELGARTRATTLIILGLLLPCMAVFLFAGGPVLSTFGGAYEHHGLTLLQLVVAAAIPDAATNIYVSVLRVQRRLAVAAFLNLAMGFGTVALSWILLPQLGIMAVGLSWLAMQLTGCAFVAVDMLRRYLSHPPAAGGVLIADHG